MNVLIVGSTGMLGRTVKKHLSGIGYEIRSLDRNTLDLSSCSICEISEAINRMSISFDYIINCSGIIKQNTKISNSDMIKVNSVIPHYLQEISTTIGSTFMHITTDCVFDGKCGGYDENSIHNATDIYGRSKSLGEPENATVIRTSIIGEESKNKLSLLEWMRSNRGKQVSGFVNHFWNGVTCLELSKIIHESIQSKNKWKGVRHIFSEVVSKNDLISHINKVYELNVVIHKTETQIIDRTLKSIYPDFKRRDLTIIQQLEEQKKFWES